MGKDLSPAVAAIATTATKIAAAAHRLSPLYHVLLALVSILLLGRWMGKLFVHFGQPRVIGEMVAGIMLGPSLLGPDLAGGAAVHAAGGCRALFARSSRRSA